VARFFGYTVLLVTLGIMQGCANRAPSPDTEVPPSTLPSQADLIGTWKFVSVTEGATGKVHPSNGWQFFMRFYPDGKFATWPVPKEEIYVPGAFNTDANRVSRGLYKVEDGQLTSPGWPNGTKAKLRVTAEKMWYWGSDGYEWLYYRVRPDLEPGQVS